MVSASRRLVFVGLLTLSFFSHDTPAQEVQPITDDVPSCQNINTSGYQGNITNADECFQACGSNGGQQAIFDRINGSLVDGTPFEAWRCGCQRDGETVFCSSIVVGDGDPMPPPEDPVDCFTLQVTTVGRCGFYCEVVYPERGVQVNYTVVDTPQGDEFRQCDCILRDPTESVTFCQGIRAATMSPTTSPTVSVAPSVSQSPTKGLIFQFPTISPEPTTVTPATPSPTTMAPTTMPSLSTSPTGTDAPSQSAVPTDLPTSSSIPTASVVPTESAVPSVGTEAPSTIPSMSPSLDPPSAVPSVSLEPSVARTTAPPVTDPPVSQMPSAQPSSGGNHICATMFAGTAGIISAAMLL